MPDVLVTIPRRFGLDRWAAEGDLPGQPWSGAEYYYFLGGAAPNILPGERVYVCYGGIIRGYAPLVRVDRQGRHGCALVRRGGAVAVTVPNMPLKGFRGFRYRWWDRDQEIPFPDWQNIL